MSYNMNDILKLIAQTVRNTVEGMKPVGIVTGEVESAAPLKIFVDQKRILDDDFCHLTQKLTDYETEVEVEVGGVKQTYPVTVKNALKKGDMVWMLQYNEGQDFLILDRMVNG